MPDTAIAFLTTCPTIFVLVIWILWGALSSSEVPFAKARSRHIFIYFYLFLLPPISPIPFCAALKH